MIRNLTVDRGEEIVALFQRVEVFIVRSDRAIGDGFNLTNVFVERCRIIHVHGLIRTEGREYLEGHVVFRHHPDMVFKGIGRIVGGAEVFYLHFSQQPLHTVFRRSQFFTGLVVYLPGGIAVKDLGDSEIALQLKMRPMI